LRHVPNLPDSTSELLVPDRSLTLPPPAGERRVSRRDALKAFGVIAGGSLVGWPVLAADTRPPPSAPFTLPWGGGERRYVLQGQNQGTHAGFFGRYAWDFARAPFDSTPYTVVAARDGVVKEILQDFDDSPDCDISYNAKANYVLLDHGDGYGSLYLHIKKGTVLPKVGQRVDRGQPIATTGHTGFLCGTTHQHFTIVDAKTRESVDVAFVDPDTARDGGRPKTDQWYWAGTPPPPGSTPVPGASPTPGASGTPGASPTPTPSATPVPTPPASYKARLPFVTKGAGPGVVADGGQRPP